MPSIIKKEMMSSPERWGQLYMGSTFSSNYQANIGSGCLSLSLPPLLLKILSVLIQYIVINNFSSLFSFPILSFLPA